MGIQEKAQLHSLGSHYIITKALFQLPKVGKSLRLAGCDSWIVIMFFSAPYLKGNLWFQKSRLARNVCTFLDTESLWITLRKRNPRQTLPDLVSGWWREGFPDWILWSLRNQILYLTPCTFSLRESKWVPNLKDEPEYKNYPPLAREIFSKASSARWNRKLNKKHNPNLSEKFFYSRFLKVDVEVVLHPKP